MIRIQADQKIAAAKAKEQEIKLSGAMTEQERIRLEIEKETRVGVAKAWAEGISKLTLPHTLMVGTGGTSSDSPVNDLIRLLTVEKADALDRKPAK